MRQPRLLYFDLGNVILNFDHRLACRQMGEVAGVSEQKVWDLVFATDLELRYEAGDINDQEFYEIFCRETGTRPELKALLLAGSAIFTPNYSIFPVIAALDGAGYRMGILSNTCPGHWNYCRDGRYGLIDMAFDVYALSYELGSASPRLRFLPAPRNWPRRGPRISFSPMTSPATSPPREAGFDAAQYTTTPALVDELRQRGLQFNY